MRLHFPLLALLALAGCAYTPRKLPSDPAPLAPLTGTRITSVQLQPVVLASSATAHSALLTVDAWLDDYFAVCRSFEEKLYHSALATHPEWAPQIGAMRRVNAENENTARAAFLYLHRTGTEQLKWHDGDWTWQTLPCNCGKVHRFDTPGWEDRFKKLTQARIALEEVSNEQFHDAYLVAVFDLRESLLPELKVQLVRLEPGFRRLMHEPGKAETPR